MSDTHAKHSPYTVLPDEPQVYELSPQYIAEVTNRRTNATSCRLNIIMKTCIARTECQIRSHGVNMTEYSALQDPTSSIISRQRRT